MLGYKRTFGSRLFYFIISGDTELGCIQFSASSWALKERDKWIGWTKEDRAQRLHLIVNNSRYLIFPWVHIPNLASHVLSLASKQIQSDYMRIYYYEPVLLETFVDPGHFLGTCYKAANWDYIGTTYGSGRTGKHGDVSQKDIYMYPLCKNFIKYLTGEKAYKKGEPDHDFKNSLAYHKIQEEKRYKKPDLPNRVNQNADVDSELKEREDIVDGTFCAMKKIASRNSKRSCKDKGLPEEKCEAFVGYAAGLWNTYVCDALFIEAGNKQGDDRSHLKGES